MESQVGDVQKLIQDDQNRRLISLLLIGSADKRSLYTQSVKRLFGSNTALAQARAEWVRKQLAAARVSQSTEAMVALHVGPSILNVISAKDVSRELALDRAVQVCALWDRTI